MVVDDAIPIACEKPFGVVDGSAGAVDEGVPGSCGVAFSETGKDTAILFAVGRRDDRYTLNIRHG